MIRVASVIRGSRDPLNLLEGSHAQPDGGASVIRGIFGIPTIWTERLQLAVDARASVIRGSLDPQ